MMYSSNAESYRQFLIDRTKQYQSIVGASPTDGQVKQASAVDFIKNNKRIQMMEKADKVGKSIKNTTPHFLEVLPQGNSIAAKAQQRAALKNRIGDSSAFGSHSGPEFQINKAHINGKNPNFGHTSTISGEDFIPKRASFDILGNFN